MQISAILSDYDGTLRSTSNVKGPRSNKIPVELDAILSKISKAIPVCVISSKDFGFLSDKITFARIVSCIMGIETINLKRLVGDELIHIKNDSNVLVCHTIVGSGIDKVTNSFVTFNIKYWLM